MESHRNHSYIKCVHIFKFMLYQLPYTHNGGFFLNSLLLLVIAALYLTAIGVSAFYYKQIRRVHEEYEEAKNTVGNIVMSFNRQLQRQENELQSVANKLETFSSKKEGVTGKVAEYSRRLDTIADFIEGFPAVEQELSSQIESMQKKVEDIKENQKKITQRIVDIGKLRYKVQPETQIESAIPIKKERALAPLTDTELTVLELIAKEGEKTAPEIREEIKLTREHTSRLMKKLYEDGYLERDTHKMPYTYRLKDEMQKILKKRETKV